MLHLLTGQQNQKEQPGNVAQSRDGPRSDNSHPKTNSSIHGKAFFSASGKTQNNVHTWGRGGEGSLTCDGGRDDDVLDLDVTVMAMLGMAVCVCVCVREREREPSIKTNSRKY